MQTHDCASLLAKLQPRFTCLLLSSTSPSCLCRLVDIFHGPLPVTPPHVDVPLSACARDNKKTLHSKAPRGSFHLNNRWMSALSLTSCLCQCAALNLVCCHVWRDDDSLVSCFLFGVVTKVRTFLFLNIFFFFIGGWYCVEIAHQTTRCVSEKPLRYLHYLGNAVPPSKPYEDKVRWTLINRKVRGSSHPLL